MSGAGAGYHRCYLSKSNAKPTFPVRDVLGMRFFASDSGVGANRLRSTTRSTERTQASSQLRQALHALKQLGRHEQEDAREVGESREGWRRREGELSTFAPAPQLSQSAVGRGLGGSFLFPRANGGGDGQRRSVQALSASGSMRVCVTMVMMMMMMMMMMVMVMVMVMVVVMMVMVMMMGLAEGPPTIGPV
eukprot:3556890-Rhodomonas_salina.2